MTVGSLQVDNGVWWPEKACNAMKETLKEMNRLKSNCSARKQYICTPERTQSPDSLAMAMAMVIS